MSDSQKTNHLLSDLACPEVSHEQIFNTLNIAIISFDVNLTIQTFNPKAQAYITIKAGEPLHEFLENNTNTTIWAGWFSRIKNVLKMQEIAYFKSVAIENKQVAHSICNLTCIPVKSLDNKTIIGGILTIEDITEKVLAQKHLDTTERFAAVGKLAGKIAHELNNPMDGILRYINLTLRILEKENLPKPAEYLAQCKSGLMRMVQIISELLEFSRSTYNSYDKMSISDIIDEVLRSLEHKISTGNYSIIRDFDNRIPKIRCGNLYQVFCNLIKNSLDAMDSDGTLKISTCFDGKGFIIIDFSDTGHGIDPLQSDKIFEPFFTTKKNGKGTGLGLAICKDIIEKYDGKITASNNYDKGSTFSMILPLENMT